MFVIVTLSSDSIFVEISSLAKYKFVTLVKLSYDNETKETVYVLADFVEKSFVGGKMLGLIGVGGVGVQNKLYIPINIRRHTFGIRLVNEKLEAYNPKLATIILHFRK